MHMPEPTKWEILDEVGEPRFEQVQGTPDEVRTWREVPGSPEILAVGHFMLSDNGPTLIGLSFTHYAAEPWPPPPVTASVVRRAPIELLYKQVRGYVLISESLGMGLDIDIREFARHPRPGRRGRDDIYYARLAAEYVELLTTSSTPTKDLAEKHHYSATVMRDYLNQARSRGLLTRPERGRAGGQLTEKARDLLTKKGRGPR
jgi:hypothetical protein